MQLNIGLTLNTNWLKENKETVVGGMEITQYCQFRMKIPTIFRGTFRIFTAISKFLYAFVPRFLAEPWSRDIDLHGS